MNKYLTLLCFSLIISQTFSKECTESDCDYTGIAEEDKEKYACVPKGEEECEKKLLCSHATKSAEDTSFKCSDYPVEEEGKKCIENSEGESTTPCKEEFICNQVNKPAEGQIDCSIYPTTDKTKYSCVADDDPEASKACKEVEYTCLFCFFSSQFNRKACDIRFFFVTLHIKLCNLVTKFKILIL